MAVIAIQDAKDGLNDVTFVAANGGGDTIELGFVNGGHGSPVLLLVKNGSAGAITVTVAGHPAIVVPITTGLGVIPVHGQPNKQARAVTYSGVTSLTVGAVRVV